MAFAFPLHQTLGALFLGSSFSCMVYGIVATQVYKYFGRYPSDRPAYKLIVLLLMALETLDQAFILHTAYFYCITNFASPFNIIRGDATFSLILQVAIGAVAGVIVKLCFAMRVYRFSERNIWITGLIMVLTVAQLGLAILYTVKGFMDPALINIKHLKLVGILSLSAGVITDAITSLALCYYLRRFRTGFNKQSDTVVNTLMRYAVNTGIITSGVSLATLITYNFRPEDMIFVGMYFVLSKLYAISFFATLNTRKSIRGRGTDRGNTNTGPVNHANTITAHSETFYMLNTFPQRSQKDHIVVPTKVNPQESFFSADVNRMPDIREEDRDYIDHDRKWEAF